MNSKHKFKCKSFGQDVYYLAAEVNKMLSEGVEVYGNDTQFDIIKNPRPDAINGCTHKALVINIEPIVRETAEDVLRAYIKAWEGGPDFPGKELVERAKAVLNE